MSWTYIMSQVRYQLTVWCLLETSTEVNFMRSLAMQQVCMYILKKIIIIKTLLPPTKGKIMALFRPVLQPLFSYGLQWSCSGRVFTLGTFKGLSKVTKLPQRSRPQGHWPHISSPSEPQRHGFLFNDWDYMAFSWPWISWNEPFQMTPGQGAHSWTCQHTSRQV